MAIGISRTRVMLLTSALKSEFGDHAEVKLDGCRYAIKADVKTEDGKYDFTSTNKTRSFIDTLCVPDKMLQQSIDDFVNREVDDFKKQVQKEASSKILKDYFYKW